MRVVCRGREAPNLQLVRPSLDKQRWYAVHCQPHREQGAALHLRNQGYDVFLPRRERTIRHARRIETVRRPFFPGYLFLHLDLSCERWRPVNGTFGVVRLIMRGDEPAPVPRGVVEVLKTSCNEDDILEWQPPLALGEAVRVTTGPFADLVGELDQLDGAGRVRVLLELMGGKVPTWLPRSGVVPAASFA